MTNHSSAVVIFVSELRIVTVEFIAAKSGESFGATMIVGCGKA